MRWHLWEIDLKFALNSTPGWGGSHRVLLHVDLLQKGQKGVVDLGVCHARDHLLAICQTVRRQQLKEMCSGSKAGSHLRLIDSCITQLEAQGPFRT